MNEDREKDKIHTLVPPQGSGKSRSPISVDVIKSAFIAEGLSVEEIADRYYLSRDAIQKIADTHNLVELRKAYIREGINKIQNVQLHQAQKMLDLELGFKKLRLIQLEDKLNDFMAYYARHGDLYKRHPATGEILKDPDGIAMQINVPNVTREINQLKESVTLSEGVKKIMSDLDSIIHGKRKSEEVTDDDVIDMEEVNQLFTARKKN